MLKAKHKRHPIFHAMIGAARIIFPVYRVEGKENIKNGSPVVFVSNHLKILGPFVILLFFPYRYRPWVISNMINIKSCTDYLKNDFVCHKLKIKIRPFSIVAAYLLALFCTKLMRSRDAIPTYRSNYKAKLTFDETKRSIMEGNNIFIFPEKDDIPFSDHLNDFYDGFAHLGKKLYIDTGMELDFHPVFIDRINKKICIMKAERFNGKNNFRDEKKRIVENIRDKINEMAVLTYKKSLENSV